MTREGEAWKRAAEEVLDTRRFHAVWQRANHLLAREATPKVTLTVRDGAWEGTYEEWQARHRPADHVRIVAEKDGMIASLQKEAEALYRVKDAAEARADALTGVPAKWRDAAAKISAYTTAPVGLTWDHGAADTLHRCATELDALLSEAGK